MATDHGAIAAKAPARGAPDPGSRLTAVRTGSLAALALIAATLLGFMFLDKGQDGASLGMALATGIAMICYGFNVWAASGAGKPGKP